MLLTMKEYAPMLHCAVIIYAVANFNHYLKIEKRVMFAIISFLQNLTEKAVFAELQTNHEILLQSQVITTSSSKNEFRLQLEKTEENEGGPYS